MEGRQAVGAAQPGRRGDRVVDALAGDEALPGCLDEPRALGALAGAGRAVGTNAATMAEASAAMAAMTKTALNAASFGRSCPSTCIAMFVRIAATAADDVDVPGATGAGAAGGAVELLLETPARAEVRTRGAVTVEILGADGTAREVLSADDGPATLFLDASLLEHLPDAVSPCTLRFYPADGDRVRVRGALAEAWALELPGR